MFGYISKKKVLDTVRKEADTCYKLYQMYLSDAENTADEDDKYKYAILAKTYHNRFVEADRILAYLEDI